MKSPQVGNTVQFHGGLDGPAYKLIAIHGPHAWIQNIHQKDSGQCNAGSICLYESLEIPPLPFRIGDCVTIGTGSTTYAIIHIDCNNKVWLRTAGGADYFSFLSKLNRAPY